MQRDDNVYLGHMLDTASKAVGENADEGLASRKLRSQNNALKAQDRKPARNILK